MVATAVIGAQWGDEGKGKIVDRLGKDADLTVRFGGGANAGHTIVVNGEKTVLHLLPSSIIREGARCLLGPGAVCSLDVLSDELAIAERSKSIVLLDRLTPVITPIHRWFDAAREAGSSGIGTTKRGIGPVYEGVAARGGVVRLGDLEDPKRVRETLASGGYPYYEERAAAARAYERMTLPPFPTLDEVVENILQYRDQVLRHLCDGRDVVWEAIARDLNILFEGAQGVMLDVWNGSSPYTTSSLCGAAGIYATFGKVPLYRVIGVAKAYPTRVGAGPFPTEMLDGTGDALRELGGEYGATTGRPRRIGMPDLVALAYAVRMGGINELAVTKMDTLSGTYQVQVCVGYLYKNEPLNRHATLSTEILTQATPLYTVIPGWPDPSACRKLGDLHKNARDYLKMIERATGCPVTAVGVGPERDQIAE